MNRLDPLLARVGTPSEDAPSGQTLLLFLPVLLREICRPSSAGVSSACPESLAEEPPLRSSCRSRRSAEGGGEGPRQAKKVCIEFERTQMVTPTSRTDGSSWVSDLKGAKKGMN